MKSPLWRNNADDVVARSSSGHTQALSGERTLDEMMMEDLQGIVDRGHVTKEGEK